MTKRKKPTGNYNRFGLPRAIPADTRLAVRQECFFGCVICGHLPYHFEHFDPQFRDAREHSVAGIALLCANHHQDRTSHRLKARAIRTAREQPYNQHHDAVWTHTLALHDDLELVFGSTAYHGNDMCVCANGRDLIRLARDETNRWCLSGNLRGPDGSDLLVFENNSVIVSQGVWDVVFQGPRLTIRTGRGAIVAELRFEAENDRVVVSRLEMFENGLSISANQDGVAINNDNVRGVVFRNNTIVNPTPAWRRHGFLPPGMQTEDDAAEIERLERERKAKIKVSF